MPGKVVLFAYNGEMMCFIQVLLNALDYGARGWETAVVVEGSATKLIPGMAVKGGPKHSIYQKVKDQGLFAGACKACSQAMKVTNAIEEAGLPLLGGMAGHPSMAAFQEKGWQVITF